MKKTSSIEANVIAAKVAVQEMLKSWRLWKSSSNQEGKRFHLIEYEAALISCKVYLENFLKLLYPDENQIPPQIRQDINEIVSRINSIEKASEGNLKEVIESIEQLDKDVA